MDEVTRKLIGCTDAQTWAREFCKVFQVHQLYEDGSGLAEPVTDAEGLMIGWFANAIMSGYDEGVKLERQRSLTERVREIAYQSAGVCSGVFMQSHLQDVMPSREIEEGVEKVLAEFGIPKE